MYQPMSFTLPIYNTLNWQEKILLFFTSMLFVAQTSNPFISQKFSACALCVIGFWILIFQKRNFHWTLFFQREITRNSGFRQISLIFILLGVPAIISLFGTYNTRATVLLLLSMVIFFTAGIALYSLFFNQRNAKILITVIAVCSILWIIDALVQQVVGTDLFGISLEKRGRWGSRVIGPFINGNNHLGMLLTITLPVTLKWLSRFHIVLQVLYICMLAIVLLGTGVKTNWITFVLALICFYWFVRGGRWSILCLTVPLLIGCIWAVTSTSPIASKKFNQLISVPTTLNGWDKKATGRLHIWAAGWNMGIENPLTGVGANSFRYAYLDHKADWDPSGHKNGITTHSHAEHQWVSIFAETGFLGVICLAGVVLLVVCLAVRSPLGFNFYHYPWLLSFLLILNPINSIPPVFKMWFFPIFLLSIISQISAVENAEREIDSGIV